MLGIMGQCVTPHGGVTAPVRGTPQQRGQWGDPGLSAQAPGQLENPSPSHLAHKDLFSQLVISPHTQRQEHAPPQ